jgi:DNA repair protein RecN (Recombination protein N)
MLTTLRIKNLALVADLTLDLQPGYNAITGETGAGKSILIGALNLLLGERADRTLIRSGAESCSVEAVFDVAKLRAPLENFLDENGVESCVDHQLVLKRTFTAAGTNKQFINGSPTTLQVLAALGEWLVDIHGPHDHQSLHSKERQLEMLAEHFDIERDEQNEDDDDNRCWAKGDSRGICQIEEENGSHARVLVRWRIQYVRE